MAYFTLSGNGFLLRAIILLATAVPIRSPTAVATFFPATNAISLTIPSPFVTYPYP